MSKKSNLTIKENFLIALENYKKSNFSITENICNKILSIDAHHFESLVLLSNIFAMNRNYQKAKDFLIKANKIKPNNLSVLNNLGTAFKELDNLKEAVSFFEQVIKINPDHTNANYNLGIIFLNAREFKKAKNFFSKTVKVQPNYAAAFIMIANINVELKEHESAVSNYQKAIEINPKLVSAHNNLGLVYRILNDFENAVKCYEEAIKLKEDHAGAHHNLAIALKEIGKFNESIKSHENAIKYEPENPSHYYYLSELKTDILVPQLKTKIEKIIQNEKASKLSLSFGNFLLAKFEQKNKNFEKEFNYLVKAHNFFFDSKKEKFNLGVKYCFEDVIQISHGVKVHDLEKSTKNIVKPIFIIGTPRCGSTLIEKIIGSGPNPVLMGEEIAVVENFINLKILEKKSLDLGTAEEIRNELIECYKHKGLISAKFDYLFTDKSLNNFFYLDLIKSIFPDAKIVHCKRNLLSSIVSIFQNNLYALPWAHNLDNILKYFDNYLNIINDFNRKYPGFIYEVQLEDLINNPETESKKLMNFCELKWDKKCLEFYKRKDLISKTASNLQIRKAIYKHEPEKYLPYKKFFDKYKEKYSWFKQL